MDPTRKKHPKSSSFPDPSSAPKISNHHPSLSRHKQLLTSLKHNNPPPRVDSRLQAKAMTVSLIAADSPNPFIIKPNPNSKHPPHPAPALAPKMDETKEKRFFLKKSSVKKDKEKKEVNDVQKALTVAKQKESQQGQGQGHGHGHGHGHDIIMGRPSASLGRRRSFCSSQIELAGFLASTGVKVVSVDMPPFMQIHAVDCARNAYDSLEKFTSKTLAFTLKKEFDGAYGPAWHCIVGTSFGSFVTHSVGGFMYFAMDHKLYILLFKTAVQRAD